LSKQVVERLLRLREGGNVERCHTTPHRGSYTDGKHTFDMLLLLEVLHPEPTAPLLRAVLRHDLHERYTGDSPGFIRRIDPKFWASLEELRARVDRDLWGEPLVLSDDDLRWLRALDAVELLLWCHDEENMGNRNVLVMKRDVQNGLSIHWHDLPVEVQEFMRYYQWKRTDDEL